MGSRRPIALHLLCALFLCAGLLPTRALAKGFQIGEVEGLIDVTAAYGLLVRTEERDLDFVGIANGGFASSVDYDDGTLNYDTGIVSNEIRLTGDLTLAWRNFGIFVRGYGFYDFETELGDRAHSEISREGESLVGAGGRLQEYYLSAFFSPSGVPVMFRIGNQIINWGEGAFLRFGTDVVNPLDFVSLLQPTASARDAFVPQGMIWAASNVFENIAIEGFYQYDWEPVVDPPVGWFFSGVDLLGGDGPNFAVAGAGRFSDRGTDLDALFCTAPDVASFCDPTMPLGFDETFMRIPGRVGAAPRDQGQYGFTIQALIPQWSASTFRVHFINYHSRLPLINGLTPNQEAIELAKAIDREASDPDDPAKRTLGLGELSKKAHYVTTYPEDIRMLGLSFATTTPRTGTLVSLELSHHFNWPVQMDVDRVLADALSPLTDAMGLTQVDQYGADEIVPGVDETHKTQLAVSLAQAFGPRLWSSQSILSVDLGWVHFDDLSIDSPFDRDSWGYSIVASLTYDGVFGGIALEPLVAFTHDVSGTTPDPAGAFLEDRKSLTVSLGVNYTNTVTADLTYVSFFGGKPLNSGVDRDFFSFNIRYYY